MRSVLREHQTQAMALLRQSLGAGHKRPIVQAPTGFGKTIMAAAIVEGARAKGNRVMFCVPSLSLIDQTVQAFWREGIRDVGVIQADHPMTDYRKPVQVCSVQTIQRRKHLPHADVVVIDEAHNWFKFYEKWFESWNAIPFIGLTATPWTKGLGKHFDDLIIAATTDDLIGRGFLSPFRVYAPSHPDLSGVRTIAGDYAEDDLAKVMDQIPLIADVVDTWKRLGQDRPTLCFAVNRAHAKHLQRRFEQSGIPAGYIDAYTNAQDREEVRKQFARGEIKVVCNVGCLTTGVDWDVRCIILARPTKSEILFTQIIGRGLRTAEGKDFCLILDHSDTHLRLGFVTDICHETLDDGKHKESTEKRKELLPKECPECAYLKPPKVSTCPQCGFKPERQPGVHEADGELQELQQGTKTQQKNNRTTSNEDKAAFYGGLLHYAQSKGYKQGWAANQYRENFGVWPNAYRHVQPCEPNESVKGWIRHQNIKWAKRRNAA